MSFDKRTTIPMCEQKHVDEFPSKFVSGAYWGKACYRYCVKYKFLHKPKTDNCKTWKIDVYDLATKSGHDLFTGAGYRYKK